MSKGKQIEIESGIRPNTVFPISGEEDKGRGDLSPLKEETEGLIIKFPEVFQISREQLVGIVMDTQQRKFCEEVDKIEALGGNYYFYSVFELF